EVADGSPAQPGGELREQRTVESERMTGCGDLRRRGRRAEHALHRVAGSDVEQHEGQRHDSEHDAECARQTEDDAPGHPTNVDLSVPRRLPLWLISLTLAC